MTKAKLKDADFRNKTVQLVDWYGDLLEEVALDLWYEPGTPGSDVEPPSYPIYQAQPQYDESRYQISPQEFEWLDLQFERWAINET